MLYLPGMEAFEIVKRQMDGSFVRVAVCQGRNARQRARTKRDRLDMAHGGYAHSIRPMGTTGVVL